MSDFWNTAVLGTMLCWAVAMLAFILAQPDECQAVDCPYGRQCIGTFECGPIYQGQTDRTEQ
jgi:hypothetical protein